MTSIFYTVDEGFHPEYAATCDDANKHRYLAFNSNAVKLSAATLDPKLLVQGVELAERGSKTLIVLGSPPNIVRINDKNSPFVPPYTLDFQGGDAGSASSSILGAWQWMGPDGEGGTAWQIGMVGALSGASSMTLYSGVAANPQDFTTLVTSPLQILKNQTSTKPLSLPGSQVIANDTEAWWAGTSKDHKSVVLLRFNATSGMAASPPFDVYDVTTDAGTDTVTQAIAAPFSKAGTGLVMWAEVSGSSATVYAQAVSCPP